MKKTKVVNIIGASGAGKTTVAKELEKLGHNVIQSYTTRPPREKDEWGHIFIEEYTISQRENNEFRFNFRRINSLGFLNIVSSKDMIAYFNSYNSGHHYFATDEQVIRGKTNLYIVDPEGAKMVHRFYEGNPEVQVETIYLDTTIATRILRMAKRWLEDNRKVGKLLTVEEMSSLSESITSKIEKDEVIFNISKFDYPIDANGTAEETKNKLIEAIELLRM